jgi:hypothetical protein
MLYHKFNYRLIEIILSYFKRQRIPDYTECSVAKLTVLAFSQQYSGLRTQDSGLRTPRSRMTVYFDRFRNRIDAE